MKTTLLVICSLLAFAGNSVLCRLALGNNLIDPAGFTTLRLLSGAITLSLLLIGLNKWQNKQQSKKRSIFGLQQLLGIVMLFTYAICFSFAYVVLETGIGALVLFGAVQLTLLFSSVITGRRPALSEWLGVILAFVGLVYLLLPSWGTPRLMGLLLMLLAGISWGLYTIIGKYSNNPLKQTTINFMGCVPLVLLLNLLVFHVQLWTGLGVILAVISGAITSGIGYTLWYSVLPKLSSSQAGVLQLLVPVIAALGGVVFANEPLTTKLFFSSALVLGGIYIVMKSTYKT